LSSVQSNPVATGEFPTEPVWVFDAAAAVVASPVVRDDMVLIKTRESLYALDGTTGEELWEADSKGEEGLAISPLVSGEYVVVPEEYSGLAAFSSHTGELLWRVLPPWGEKTRAMPSTIESTALSGGLAYVARFDWPLIAYDLTNGQSIWQAPALSGRDFPFIQADTEQIYLAAGDELRTYSSKTGELLSAAEFGGYLGPILLEDRMLYVADEQENTISALDMGRDNGNTLWAAQLPGDLDTFELRCLAVQDDVLYVAADRLFALSRGDGRLLWSTEETGRLECPVFLNDRVYVRNTGRTLYVFNPETGGETGRLSIKENTVMKHGPFRSPAVVRDLLLVPFGDGRIFAYRP
jgi:outer membrane protein assembly factor BamB